MVCPIFSTWGAVVFLALLELDFTFDVFFLQDFGRYKDNFCSRSKNMGWLSKMKLNEDDKWKRLPWFRQTELTLPSFLFFAKLSLWLNHSNIKGSVSNFTNTKGNHRPFTTLRPKRGRSEVQRSSDNWLNTSWPLSLSCNTDTLNSKTGYKRNEPESQIKTAPVT